MVDFIVHLPSFAAYAVLYAGIIFMGGVALLGGMLLALSGKLSMWLVFLDTIVAAFTADAIWYAIGYSAKKDKLYSWAFVQRRIEEAKKFSAFFEEHGVLLVFITKFIWGTRLASHILAGMHKVRFWKFALSTACGTAVWFFIFFILLKFVDAGIVAAKATAVRIQLIFLILFLIVFALNWFTGSYVRKRITQT